MSKRKVLFLCTGNSCRSQMAEAIVNARLGDAWEAFSAGTQPADNVHPKATAVLAEIGIRHEGRAKNRTSSAERISTWSSRCATTRWKIALSGWGKANAFI